MTILFTSDAAICFKVLSNRNCHQSIRSTFLSILILKVHQYRLHSTEHSNAMSRSVYCVGGLCLKVYTLYKTMDKMQEPYNPNILHHLQKPQYLTRVTGSSALLTICLFVINHTKTGKLNSSTEGN